MTDESAAPASKAGAADAPAADLGRPGRILGIVAGVMILIMMAVTTVDVIGRDLFNVPLFGAFEMTEILMGLVIFAGMPLTTAAREHITVNLFESAVPRRVRCIQAGAGDALSAAVAAVMAWRIYWRGIGLIDAHETTMMLGIGRGYIAIAMSVLLATTALVFVYSAYRAFEAAAKRP